MYCNGIIVGAGIVGSAIACELALRGTTDIHVFDADLEGELGATAASAHGARHLFRHRVNAELARASLAYFESLGPRIGYRTAGHLILHDAATAEIGKKQLAVARELGLPYEGLAPLECAARYPFLDKPGGLALAVHGPKDGLVDAKRLRDHYRATAKEHGVTFHDRSWMLGANEVSGAVWVETATLEGEDDAAFALKNPGRIGRGDGAELWECSFVVLCGGAWSPTLLQGLTETPPVRILRRRVSVLKPEHADFAGCGVVVDPSGTWFHPMGAELLAGTLAADEKPGYRYDYDFTYFEKLLWPALYERSSFFEKLRHVRGWSGVEAFTPDGSGILGIVPGARRVYEAQNFATRGIMQSRGIGVAMADLILTGGFQSIDAAALSRERFLSGDRAKLLSEATHY